MVFRIGETRIMAETARDRLEAAARHAVLTHFKNIDGAKDALVRAIRNDPELLWELFAAYRQSAINCLVTQASIRASGKAPALNAVTQPVAPLPEPVGIAPAFAPLGGLIGLAKPVARDFLDGPASIVSTEPLVERVPREQAPVLRELAARDHETAEDEWGEVLFAG